MITKSIIENFELESGTEVYVQASMTGRITVSFDGNATNVSQYMTKDEAKEFVSKLNKVIEESN